MNFRYKDRWSARKIEKFIKKERIRKIEKVVHDEN